MSAGRKKTTSLTYKRTVDRLRALAPLAMQQIEEAIQRRSVSQDEQRAIDNAWRVIEHVKGKPKQDVEVSGSQGGPIAVKAYCVVSPDDWE